MNDALRIEDAGRLAARIRGFELELFTITGRRATSSSIDSIAHLLHTASLAHGYRASLFEIHLLVSDGLQNVREESIELPSSTTRALLCLEAADDVTLASALLFAVYPLCRSAMRELVGELGDWTHGSFRRALRRAIFDLELSSEVVKNGGSGDEMNTPESTEIIRDIAGLLGAEGGPYGSAPGLVRGP